MIYISNPVQKAQEKGFAALGTTEADAGVAAEQLASVSKPSKKHHYGYYGKKIVEGIDSWFIINNKPLFLLTALDLCDEPDVPKPALKCGGIPLQDVFIYNDDEMIPFKPIFIRYNKHIVAADLNAQV